MISHVHTSQYDCTVISTTLVLKRLPYNTILIATMFANFYYCQTLKPANTETCQHRTFASIYSTDCILRSSISSTVLNSTAPHLILTVLASFLVYSMSYSISFYCYPLIILIVCTTAVAYCILSVVQRRTILLLLLSPISFFFQRTTESIPLQTKGILWRKYAIFNI